MPVAHTIADDAAHARDRGEFPQHALIDRCLEEARLDVGRAGDEVGPHRLCQHVDDGSLEALRDHPEPQDAAEADAQPQAPLKVEGAESEQVDAPAKAKKKASPKKPASDKNA